MAIIYSEGSRERKNLEKVARILTASSSKGHKYEVREWEIVANDKFTTIVDATRNSNVLYPGEIREAAELVVVDDFLHFSAKIMKTLWWEV